MLCAPLHVDWQGCSHMHQVGKVERIFCWPLTTNRRAVGRFGLECDVWWWGVARLVGGAVTHCSM